MALQYGVPLSALVNKFAHMRFEPAGWTGNPDIPNAKSVPDYIFRWLGMQFIAGFREANAPQRNGHDAPAVDESSADKGESTAGEASALRGEWPAVAGKVATPGAVPAAVLTNEGPHIRSQQFARFQADAPSCDNCGAITVRNGNCYLCHNCGNSMGCS